MMPICMFIAKIKVSVYLFNSGLCITDNIWTIFRRFFLIPTALLPASSSFLIITYNHTPNYYLGTCNILCSY